MTNAVTDDTPDTSQQVDDTPPIDTDGGGASSAENSEIGDTSETSETTSETDEATTAEATSETGHGVSRLAQLEREGEVAADFLEKLLDIADLDGDIDVDVDGDRAAVAIVDSEEGPVTRRLVGEGGRVLDALQELTRLAVTTATGERSRLMLDVAGHRAARRAELVQLAEQGIEAVRSTGAPQPMPNLSAYERKVMHDVVAAAGLQSESEGVEPSRHIVILPA